MGHWSWTMKAQCDFVNVFWRLLAIFYQIGVKMLLFYHDSLALFTYVSYNPLEFWPLWTGTASSMWPKHFTPFSMVPIIRSYNVLHNSSLPRGIFPCSTSATDWLIASYSDDMENSTILISLLSIFHNIQIYAVLLCLDNKHTKKFFFITFITLIFKALFMVKI